MQGAKIATADELIDQALVEACTPEEQVAALKRAVTDIHFAYTALRLAADWATRPASHNTPGMSYITVASRRLGVTVVFGYEFAGEDHIPVLTEVRHGGMNWAPHICVAEMCTLQRELGDALDAAIPPAVHGCDVQAS